MSAASWAAPVDLSAKVDTKSINIGRRTVVKMKDSRRGYAKWDGVPPSGRSENMRRIALIQHANRSPEERRKIALGMVKQRMKKIPPERRSELARIAARARWDRG